MKKKTTLIILLFISFYSYSQKNITDYTCNCINEIPENPEEVFIPKQVQLCFENGYMKFKTEIRDLVKEYLKNNPNSTLEDAQKKIPNILGEKLFENCTKYREIGSKFVAAQKGSKDVIPKIANEFCSEINKIEDLTDKLAESILLKITKKNQFNLYSQYDLNNSMEMERYRKDLKKEIAKECNRYQDLE